MVWALVLGFLVWNDFPSWIVLGGAVIIILSGLYILHREALQARRRAAAARDAAVVPTPGGQL
jgi:hypothetical protein